MQDETVAKNLEAAVSAAVAKPIIRRVGEIPKTVYTNTILNEREKTHGDFKLVAEVSQSIKFVMREAIGWEHLSAIEVETLEMIATKIGRILSGNPNFKDHWVDIAGYATLVAERV